MSNSKYSIHDISRVELNINDLPRFNMPLECGVDFGIKEAGGKKLKQKCFLILERDKYRYQQFISDIAGNDIRAHNNKAEDVVKPIRDWLQVNTKTSMDYPSEIWNVYNEYLKDLTEIALGNNLNPHSISSMTFSELIAGMQTWINGWQERE